MFNRQFKENIKIQFMPKITNVKTIQNLTVIDISSLIIILIKFSIKTKGY